jgi:hypothetical protein|tara:strand:+ start:511 stop:687 length:177 start_codon:yes stop_codon:yes gene_type:complete
MSEKQTTHADPPDLFTDMSRRDWLAGIAMQSLIKDVPLHKIPTYCYEIADAMIKASND